MQDQPEKVVIGRSIRIRTPPQRCDCCLPRPSSLSTSSTSHLPLSSRTPKISLPRLEVIPEQTAEEGVSSMAIRDAGSGLSEKKIQLDNRERCRPVISFSSRCVPYTFTRQKVRTRMRIPSRGLSSGSSSTSSPISHIPKPSGSPKTSPPRSEVITDEIAEGSLTVRNTGSSVQLGQSSHRGFKFGTASLGYEPYIINRPSEDFINTFKFGKSGKEFGFTVNCYRLEKATYWTLYQYHVIFEPEPEMDHLGTNSKKSLILQNQKKIGPYTYDGDGHLCTAVNLGDNLTLEEITKEGGKQNVILRMVKILEPSHSAYLQFFNKIRDQLSWDHSLIPIEVRQSFYRNRTDPETENVFEIIKQEY